MSAIPVLLHSATAPPEGAYATLRALYGFMFGHPGKKLLFMGGEIGQYREWDFEGELDFSHALRCLQIGVAHHRVRLTPQWFVASHGHFVCAHLP